MPPLGARDNTAEAPDIDESPAAARRRQLDALAHGDDDALAQLVAEFGDLVYGIIYRLTANAADAEDAAQESSSGSRTSSPDSPVRSSSFRAGSVASPCAPH